MFFDVVPCMVRVQGYMVKLEVMDCGSGVPANHQYSSVLGRDASLFLSCFLDHQSGDQGMSASGMCMSRGCGSFGVRSGVACSNSRLWIMHWGFRPAISIHCHGMRCKNFPFAWSRSSARGPWYEYGWYEHWT
ncbi:unnamed protein product [Lactuca virosa]|uniref:Uncharacterized protein n=1 Tax=Lactuca virosa TaxID=75947 RepID=A0AAU9M5Q2_9ASTR|nr:unnamed protein product [Lactuca virosa]